jgi:hypothetical protein
MSLVEFVAYFNFLSSEYVRLVAEATFHRQHGNHGIYLHVYLFCVCSGLHRSPVATSSLVLLYLFYSSTSSMYPSPGPCQPGHPCPLPTDKRPSTTLRGVRIFRYASRSSLRRTSTAAPGCHLQVVLPATHPCLLTSLSFYETPCHCFLL